MFIAANTRRPATASSMFELDEILPNCRKQIFPDLVTTTFPIVIVVLEYIDLLIYAS